MRMQRDTYGTRVWISARDTYDWAHKPGACWPCSTLSDRSVFCDFDARGNLQDFRIDSGRGPQDCDAHELDAMLADLVGSAHPEALPALPRDGGDGEAVRAVDTRLREWDDGAGSYTVVEIADIARAALAELERGK